MAVRPEVRGRILVEEEGGKYLLRFKLEVLGGRFIIPGGALIEAEKPITLEYRTVAEPGRYYSPVEALLPRPLNPYTLVDYSVVYEHSPRIEVIQGDENIQSTTVLTSTAYTMVEGAAYPHLLVTRPGVEVRIGVKPLAAYPITTGDKTLDAYIRAEYELLRRGDENPYLHAALQTCKPYSCELEALWRRRIGVERLQLIPRDWAKLRGFEPSRIEPVSVAVEDGGVRAEGYGLVAVHLACGSDTFVFEVFVNGRWTWKPWRGCRLELYGYSSLCPFCIRPPQ